MPWLDRPRTAAPLAPLALCAGLLLSLPAHAMHLADGILPLGWASAWTVSAVPIIVLGLTRLRRRTRQDPGYPALAAMLSAAVFVISCMPIPVPTAGTCSHPCGTGLAAIFLGPLLTVVISLVALTLQALLLAHGGLTTLGANVWSMGIVGGFAGYLAFRIARTAGASLWVAGFAAGLLSDWATYATTSVELASALHGTEPFGATLKVILLAFVPTQLPLGLLEGLVTAGAVTFVARRRPALLSHVLGPPVLAGET